MRKIINFSERKPIPEDVMIHTIELYRNNPDVLKLARGEEHYTIRYGFLEGVADIHVDVLPNYYLFRVNPVNSALLVAKSNIPSFEVGLSLSQNHKLQYHKTPYDREARDWLKKKVFNWRGETSNADYLIVLATVCQMIWSFLLPTMRVREYGDVIEYSPREDFKTFADEWVKALRSEFKKKHRLDGWDVVNLTSKQLEKLGHTLEEHHIAHDFDNIPLHRFCLSLYEADGKYFQYFFITQTNGNLHFDIEDDGTTATAHCDISYKKTPTGELELELLDNTNALTWLTKTAEIEGGEQVTHWQWMVDVFFSINSFMLNFGDVTMEVETKEVHEQSGNRSQRRHEHRNSVRLFKSYRLIKNWKSQARKKAEITCPAWGVRGHFRHLRNGKVIFIEPFVKGKERDKYKGKEYNLLPYKDA